MNNRITLAFTPCPNDLFVFYPILKNKIDEIKNTNFEIIIEDISTINQYATTNSLDFTKLSTFAYNFLKNDYNFLKVGSVIVFQDGPILISKIKIYPDEVEDVKIGIPGLNTTAFSLLLLKYNIKKENIKVYKYNDLMEAVLDNEIEASLIIHEQRFIYQKYKLKKIIDFGEWWFEEKKLPLPLALITYIKTLPPEQIIWFENILQKSLLYSFDHYYEIINFIADFTKNKNKEIIYKHICTFVNEFTLDIGKLGNLALNTLLKEYENINNKINEFINNY